MNSIQKIMTTLVLSLIVVSCSKQEPKSAAKYHDLKEKNYSNLSEAEKVMLRSELPILLKEDEIFKEYAKNIKDLAYHNLSRKHKKGERIKGPMPRNSKDALLYLKQQGFADPEGYMKTFVNLIYFQTKLINKYPQLGQMDHSSRKAILAGAGTALTRMDMKKSFKIIKENRSSFSSAE